LTSEANVYFYLNTHWKQTGVQLYCWTNGWTNWTGQWHDKLGRKYLPNSVGFKRLTSICGM